MTHHAQQVSINKSPLFQELNVRLNEMALFWSVSEQLTRWVPFPISKSHVTCKKKGVYGKLLTNKRREKKMWFLYLNIWFVNVCEVFSRI